METTLAKAALPRSRPPRRRAALFALSLLGLSLLGLSLLALSLLALSSAAQAWQRPHGVGSNTGLEDVVTAAAVTPLRPPVSLGSLAVGAGPVVAPDGTVYVGTIQGDLKAFHPDGTPSWTRTINGQMIVASPVIDSRGNVYVVGIQSFTDHRVSPAVEVRKSILHKFTASGGWAAQIPFPEPNGGYVTNAAPNIWRYGEREVILVPVTYFVPVVGQVTHLVGFSTDGQVVADVQVGNVVGHVEQVGGLADWQVPLCFVPPFFHCYVEFGFKTRAGSSALVQPLPNVAVFTYPGGGSPFIVVADGYQTLVGYTFSTGQLIETFRVRDDSGMHIFRATPMVAPDGHSIMGAAGGIRFGGPNMNAVATIPNLLTDAAPTQLRNGRIVVVTVAGGVGVLNNNALETTLDLGGHSMVSAAASHNQFFVSTSDALVTIDSETLQEVGRYAWQGGGLSTPVIGPQGNVYVVAAQQLYTFPSAAQLASSGAGTGGTPAPTPPATGNGGAQPDTQAAQTFKPPLTAAGNRLFACLDLDGDDCGKNDARQIAQEFCTKQGFSAAGDIKTDKKKVTAETLDGQYCSKKKCKVFEKIVCEM